MRLMGCLQGWQTMNFDVDECSSSSRFASNIYSGIQVHTFKIFICKFTIFHLFKKFKKKSSNGKQI